MKTPKPKAPKTKAPSLLDCALVTAAVFTTMLITYQLGGSKCPTDLMNKTPTTPQVKVAPDPQDPWY